MGIQDINTREKSSTFILKKKKRNKNEKDEKVECLNNCFTSITNVDDNNAQLQPFYAKTQNLLSDISCSAGEIETLRY